MAIAALLSIVGAGALWLLRDPLPGFLERRSQLTAVDEGPLLLSAGHVTQAVRLRASSGLEIELLLRYPEGMGVPSVRHALGTDVGEGEVSEIPMFLILGGYRTGERAATLLDDTRGALVAAVGYPYDGPLDVKGIAVARHVPRIRRALLDTPPGMQLALDYLLDRTGVDPQRVELVGVSFGAPFAAIAAALDQRVSRLWLVHGAGLPRTLIEHNLRASVPVAALRWPLAAIVNVVAAGPRLAPEVWLPRVAPRPVIMINAIDDERLPRRAVEALFASASQPKEQIWLPGQHVQSNRHDVVQSLVEVLLSRAMEDGDLDP